MLFGLRFPAHPHLDIIIITRQGASADKLHVKAANTLPLDGVARPKQDPINRGLGAQYSYGPPPAGAKFLLISKPNLT